MFFNIFRHTNKKLRHKTEVFYIICNFRSVNNKQFANHCNFVVFRDSSSNVDTEELFGEYTNKERYHCNTDADNSHLNKT